MCEAQQERGFEYMDEQSIDGELKCSICTDPFIDPVVTPSCDHTFCRSGIESALKNKTACPNCRHDPLFLTELKPPSRILTNLLNRILVRCNKCGGTNIQREFFDEHIKRWCPKVEISCSATDLNCGWIGPRDQLSSHLANCIYEAMRPTFSHIALIVERLDRMQRENQQLKLQVNDMTHRCNRYETENHKMKQNINTLEQQYTQSAQKKR
jgi:hypothetical protein